MRGQKGCSVLFEMGASSSFGKAMLIERFRRRLWLYLLGSHVLIIASILLSLHLRIHGYWGHLRSHGMCIRKRGASGSLVW